MATLKTTRLSAPAKAALKLLASRDFQPDEYFFAGQKFHFPTEKLADLADITSCTRAAEYSVSNDTTLNLLYNLQSDNVRIWGETEGGTLFSLRLSEREARRAIVASELAKDNSGYLLICGDEGDRSFSLQDFCEGQTNYPVSEVADAIFTAWLLVDGNAERLFSDREAPTVSLPAPLAVAA